MTKEIKEMLKLGNKNKTLQLNGMFKLQASYNDENSFNVELSGKAPVEVKLELIYILKHDKYFLKTETIESKNVDGVIEEIELKMEKMLNEITLQLVQNFKNGYLKGNVVE